MFVLQVFRPHLNFQVTMNLDKRRSHEIVLLFIIASTTVLIAASTKKEANVDFKIVAEDGKIEEPLLRERTNSGIYKRSLQKHNIGGLKVCRNVLY